MTYLGVYVGPTGERLFNFEEWVGREVDSVAIHTGRKDWADWHGSIGHVIRQFGNIDRDATFSIPLFANEGNLASAAAGQYNDHYVEAAKRLLATWGDQDVIYVRAGEEFNGNWFPWAAKGQEQNFINAFRQFVDSFRSVSDKFQFEWNVAVGNMGMDPSTAYPGDAYVDVIGMDFYWNTKWDGTEPESTWDYMVNRKWGLQWHQDFAAAHGKPTSYSEWGVMGDNAGSYIENAAQWFEDHDVLYHNYWDSNSVYAGKMSENQYPTAGEAFREAFAETPPSAEVPAEPAPEPELPLPSLEPLIDLVKSAISIVIDENVLNVKLTGPASIDATGNGLDNHFTGNKAANTLYGFGGNDTFEGWGGKDVFYGGFGDDTYKVEDGTETVVEYAGEGVDTVIAGTTYFLPENVENLVLVYGGRQAGYGNTLDNRISGTTGANRLEGRVGNDTLDGMKGNDTLVGGRGDDVLVGGEGADTFLFYRGDGSDVVVDFGAGGRDVLDLSSYKVKGKLPATLTESGGDTIITFSNSTDVIRLMGVDADDLVATSVGYAHV